jgi:hypothetical protein
MIEGVVDGSKAKGLAPGTRDARGALSELQPVMGELLRRVQVVDMRTFETLAAERVWNELYPAALGLVREARAIVQRVLELCQVEEASVELIGEVPDAEVAAPILPFERAIDAAVEGHLGSVSAVENMAFIVGLELRQREERLGHLTSASGVLALIGECDSALRRIRKGLCAVDVALAEACGVARGLDFASELQESLTVRAAYAKFRGRVLAGGTPTLAGVHARVRAMGTHIAMLVGWEAYPCLRARDRLQLRDLQQRILTWLLPENRSNALAGLRLWQDLVGFADLLVQVNRRQELVEHDGRLVRRALFMLRGGEPLAGAAIADLLRPLEGLDDGLDRLLEAEPPASAPEFVERLEALAPRLGVSGEVRP